jgi:hypothetical protein
MTLTEHFNADILDPKWSSDSIFNMLLPTSDQDVFFQDVPTSSPDSTADHSPYFDSSTSSPFSSPIPCGDEFQYNVDLAPEFFSPIPSHESLDSIIQSISNSYFPDPDFLTDTNLFSEPPTKKRKHAELEMTSPESFNCGQISNFSSILVEISQGKKIMLSREQLLQISSKEFDDYRQKLNSHHILTPDEKENLKKQRRVIKNREYSQSSRQKKRQRVTELEERISQLEAENAQLAKDNQTLKAKLWKVVSAYQRSKMEMAPAPVIKSEPVISSTSSFYDFVSIGSPSTKTATACLFVFLFSFAIMFAYTGGPSNFGPATHRTGRIILSSEVYEEEAPLFQSTSFWALFKYFFFSDPEAQIEPLNYNTSLQVEKSLGSKSDQSSSTSIPLSSSTSTENSQSFDLQNTVSVDATHLCDHQLYSNFENNLNVTQPAV